ncbi:Plasma membrane low glucose sensor [Podochytrium sp. JEL0797]|nr:Plasma membrane low glucose sensor [Podochytrium sp. JEL0797]
MTQVSSAKGSSTYNWLVGFAAGIGGLLFGYEIGVIGQVLGMVSFQMRFALIEMDGYGMPVYNSDGETIESSTKATSESWITSSFLIGCVFGAALCSYLADKLGRKKCILITGGLFAIGGAIQCAVNTLTPLIIGRLLSGLAIGIASLVVPIYIAETASPSTRGALTTIYQLMITLGIFIATGVNSIIITAVDNLNEFQWRLALGMQIAPAAVLLILVSMIPESPRWLADHDQHETAQHVIAKLRGLDFDDSAVVAEYKEIHATAEFDKSLGNAPWSEVFQGSNVRRVVISVINQTLQQLSGINIILYYSASIFKAMGFSYDQTVIAFPLANAAINFLATFPAMWAVERFGRKSLLTWGGVGMAIGHAGVFTFLTLSDSNQSMAWGAIISIYIFLICFASTWGPVVWSYNAEIFPLRVRAKGASISTMTNWIWNAILAFGFPQVFAALNYEPVVYWIFFTFCAIMFVYARFYIPETKGLSLEEIGAVFGDQVVGDVEGSKADSK